MAPVRVCLIRLFYWSKPINGPESIDRLRSVETSIQMHSSGRHIGDNNKLYGNI